MHTIRFAAAFGVATLIAGAAEAQNVVLRNLTEAQSAARLDIARAKPVPRKNLAASDAAARSAQAETGPSDLVPWTTPGDAGRSTRAHGSFGIPYASTRVQAGPSSSNSSNPNYLATTYPYRAIGAMFFTDGSGTYLCSASVIRRGVIVTAAHCVQDYGAGPGGAYTGHQFIPAYYGVGSTTAQQRPYGTWTGRTIAVAPSYVSGNDTGNGNAVNNDVAVIAIAPLNGRFIGDVVGKLGYGANGYGFVTSANVGNLRTAAVSTLGYPGLLDGGDVMQRSDGPAYETTVSSALQIRQGSDFTGGSSGGPWIVNFYSFRPTRTGGSVLGASPNMAVIGVTSWGSSDPNVPKDNYSSRFAQNKEYPSSAYGSYGPGNIGALLNRLCTSVVPGTSQTYSAAGYCS